MAINVASLLVHSDAVSGPARQALIEASRAAPEEREAKLQSAAKLLYAETDLECSEVRDLVGLPASASCG